MNTTETYKNLRFEIETGTAVGTGKAFIWGKAFRGKAAKPYAFYSFPTMTRLDSWIEGEKTTADQAEAYKIERKAEKSKLTEKNAGAIGVGTLLCYTWGWEQTNQDFFEVVAKSGRAVTLRPVAAEMVLDGGCGPMSGQVKAVPGKYTGEPIKKMIGAHGISMDFGNAVPTTADESHYRSWYA